MNPDVVSTTFSRPLEDSVKVNVIWSVFYLKDVGIDEDAQRSAILTYVQDVLQDNMTVYSVNLPSPIYTVEST